MRASALLAALVCLTACGTNRRVAFTHRPTPPVIATADLREVTTSVKAPPSELSAALAEYRAVVSDLLTAIWTKPEVSAKDAATYLTQLDRVLAVNAKLLAQRSLSDADRLMLTEGAQVMSNVRQNLLAQLTRTPTPTPTPPTEPEASDEANEAKRALARATMGLIIYKTLHGELVSMGVPNASWSEEAFARFEETLADFEDIGHRLLAAFPNAVDTDKIAENDQTIADLRDLIHQLRAARGVAI